MKKILLILFASVFSFTSAFARDDNHRPELARDTEPEVGGEVGGSHYRYLFVSYCGLHYSLTVDHKLSDDDIAYWRGYYDGLCPKNIYYI